MEESQPCNDGPCPVDCIVTDWTSWDECSTTCGGGLQYRDREIQRESAHGGEPCPEELEESQECGMDPCPIDCVMNDWKPWSECSDTCGGGIQTRYRTVMVTPAFGGVPCPTNVEEEQVCNDYPCPVDCEVTPWSEWTICDVICDGGVQSRTRDVASQALYGGKPCSDFDMSEENACNEEPCRKFRNFLCNIYLLWKWRS